MPQTARMLVVRRHGCAPAYVVRPPSGCSRRAGVPPRRIALQCHYLEVSGDRSAPRRVAAPARGNAGVPSSIKAPAICFRGETKDNRGAVNPTSACQLQMGLIVILVIGDPGDGIPALTVAAVAHLQRVQTAGT
jgi:hypothetical protein